MQTEIGRVAGYLRTLHLSPEGVTEGSTAETAAANALGLARAKVRELVQALASTQFDVTAPISANIEAPVLPGAFALPQANVLAASEQPDGQALSHAATSLLGEGAGRTVLAALQGGNAPAGWETSRSVPGGLLGVRIAGSDLFLTSTGWHIGRPRTDPVSSEATGWSFSPPQSLAWAQLARHGLDEAVLGGAIDALAGALRQSTPLPTGDQYPFTGFQRKVSNGSQLTNRAPTAPTKHAETDGLDAVIAGNDYRTTRDLLEYLADFGPWLQSALEGLTGKDRILDGGCGDAFFGEDLATLQDRGVSGARDALFGGKVGLQWTLVYFGSLPDPSEVARPGSAFGGFEPGKMQRLVYDGLVGAYDKVPPHVRPFLDGWAHRPLADRPAVTAVTYSLNGRIDSDFDQVRERAPGHLDVVTGSYFIDVPAERLVAPGQEKFSLYVDNKGVLTYTRTPSEDLRRILDVTTPDATMLLTTGNENSFVTLPSGESVPFERWLASIPGLNVEVESRIFAGDHSGREFRHAVIRITKEPGAQVTIPQLEFVSAEGTNAPKRTFRQVEG